MNAVNYMQLLQQNMIIAKILEQNSSKYQICLVPHVDTKLLAIFEA